MVAQPFHDRAAMTSFQLRDTPFDSQKAAPLHLRQTWSAAAIRPLEHGIRLFLHSRTVLLFDRGLFVRSPHDQWAGRHIGLCLLPIPQHGVARANAEPTAPWRAHCREQSEAVVLAVARLPAWQVDVSSEGDAAPPCRVSQP